ncbi:hypothetical protein I6B53_02695 [Schaalia sp. 19OD2882]|uniref:hypothetical protein n=1 Tax=Schaalia sp. 19OD2882 TaxID=2794089 RepID=UPI001C1EB78F|nr:hypothetical protein [Schaalia sp. 19OD2882]QWW20032.1 hypothetical protein I6B53_02695 [Schaalia sp. 19OD2882]
MSSARPSDSLRSQWTKFAMHGAGKRAPDGRKLTGEELRALDVVARINAPLLAATRAAADAAKSPDVGWVLGQFLDPVSAASRKGVKIPDVDILMRAIARIEDLAAGVDAEAPHARTVPRRKLREALDGWIEAALERRKDARWKQVQGTPVTLAQFRAWREATAEAAESLQVIPHLPVIAAFERALSMVVAWDAVLERRGLQGERFSLRREVVRLHNWPGDQWRDGDDFAAAQNRFHRRLRKARKLAADPVRDRVMERALYLREGLLLGEVEPVDWFLAVCRFRWAVPEALDVRAQISTWRFVEWLARWGRPSPARVHEDVPAWVGRALDPRDIPAELLTAVSGPRIMIDLDEDVVTALPPGCKVLRLVLSARGPLGPDWTVYWVESEWEDSRPILDLVESEKLHPEVLFVSDERPSDLAEVVGPFLDRAFQIPTHALTAHSHTPGVLPMPEWFPYGVPGRAAEESASARS